MDWSSAGVVDLLVGATDGKFLKSHILTADVFAWLGQIRTLVGALRILLSDGISRAGTVTALDDPVYDALSDVVDIFLSWSAMLSIRLSKSTPGSVNEMSVG